MTKKKNFIESTAAPIDAEVIEVQPEKVELTPQERINRCNAGITEVLRTYNCDILVSMILEPPNTMRPLIRLMPKV